MSLKKLASLSVIVAVFGFAACSDDTTTPPKKDGKVADQKVTDQKVTDQKVGDMKATDAKPGDLTKTDAPAGACKNATDPAALQKTYGGKTIVEIVSSQAACLLDPNPKACIVAAVKTATNSEITEPCITCFADSAICSATKCIICITAPTGADCIKCRCGANPDKVNCVKQFTDCAGIPSTTTCP